MFQCPWSLAFLASASRLARACAVLVAWLVAGTRPADEEVVLLGHLVDQQGTVPAADAVEATLEERTSAWIDVWGPRLSP